jgi:hypothetical protein
MENYLFNCDVEQVDTQDNVMLSVPFLYIIVLSAQPLMLLYFIWGIKNDIQFDKHNL